MIVHFVVLGERASDGAVRCVETEGPLFLASQACPLRKWLIYFGIFGLYV